MRRAIGPLLVGFLALGLPEGLSADVDVTTLIDLNTISITTPGCATCSVQLTPSFANAFGSVFDSLGGAATGSDFFELNAASASASTSLANWSGAADTGALTANSSSAVHIHNPVGAEAGTVPGGTYGDLGGPPGVPTGTFEIVDTSGAARPVTVAFLAGLKGDQELKTDAAGVKATSEVTFFLIINNMQELFVDTPLAIGPSSTLSHPFTTTLTNSDNTLLTNTIYSFEANVDAESYGLNTPEPSYIWVTGSICLLFLARRIFRTE
jgi:hypothetical protein